MVSATAFAMMSSYNYFGYSRPAAAFLTPARSRGAPSVTTAAGRVVSLSSKHKQLSHVEACSSLLHQVGWLGCARRSMYVSLSCTCSCVSILLCGSGWKLSPSFLKVLHSVSHPSVALFEFESSRARRPTAHDCNSHGRNVDTVLYRATCVWHSSTPNSYSHNSTEISETHKSPLRFRGAITVPLADAPTCAERCRVASRQMG